MLFIFTFILSNNFHLNYYVCKKRHIFFYKSIYYHYKKYDCYDYIIIYINLCSNIINNNVQYLYYVINYYYNNVILIIIRIYQD